MLNKEWFYDKINSFLREDESNRMTGVDGILIWEPDVIVGFCSGDDRSIHVDSVKSTYHVQMVYP